MYVSPPDLCYCCQINCLLRTTIDGRTVFINFVENKVEMLIDIDMNALWAEMFFAMNESQA